MINTAFISEISTNNIIDNNIDDLHDYLNAVLSYLNKVFKKSIKTKVEVIDNETIQGSFASSISAYLYTRQLQLLLFPIEINCGIGEGQIYIEDNWRSSEIDGPALYNAKRALEVAKASEHTNVCYISFSKVDKYLNTMLSISNFLKRTNSITINLIKIMAEIFYPLYKKDSMDIIDYNDEDLKKVFLYKEKFYNILSSFDESIKGVYPDAKSYQLPKLSDCEFVDFESLYNQKKNELISCFWKRGYSRKISIAMNNTTRQNVDKHLDGGIIEQRNLDGTICLLFVEKKIDVL